ncbi:MULTISPECIES: hypothetical protein, partial [unclassified Mesorhizobium]
AKLYNACRRSAKQWWERMFHSKRRSIIFLGAACEHSLSHHFGSNDHRGLCSSIARSIAFTRLTQAKVGSLEIV